MKKLTLSLAILSFLLSFAGCRSAKDVFYQVYQVTPTSQMEIVGTKMLFENSEVACWYDLWANGGSSSIEFQNKTSETVILFLNRSIFALNDNLFSIYDFNAAATADSLWLATHPSYLVLNPNSTISVDGFVINNRYFLDPALKARPKDNSFKTISFNQDEAPFVFGNDFAYTVGNDTTLHHIKQNFYVSQITNRSENEMFDTIPQINADSTESSYVYYCKSATPNNFFVQYNPDDIPGNFNKGEAAYLLSLFLLISLILLSIE